MNVLSRPIKLQGVRDSLPWGKFFFLFVVFFLATPYELFYSLTESATIERFIDATNQGSLGRRVGMVALGCYALLFLTRNRGMLRAEGRLGWLILSFLAVAIASIIWSEDVGITFRRVVVLVMLWLGALAIAMQFSYREIIFFGFLSASLTILIGVALEVGLGTFTPLNSDYRYIGVVHPNVQALNCGILILTGTSLASNSKHGRWFYLLGALIGFAFLLLTKSRTVFWSICFSLCTLALLAPPKRYIPAVACSLIFFVCGYFILAVNGIINIDVLQTLLFGPLGRHESGLDALVTMNGRLPVWKECIGYLAQHPLLGYGYGAFWTEPRVWEISEIAGWIMPNAHNGYLDMALELGLIGSALFIAILIEGFRRCLNFYKYTRLSEYSFVVSLLIFFGIVNLLGSRFVSVSIATFIVFVILIKLSSVSQLSYK